jgi:hydroxymethylpyrimidine pyrophosphatase-like HAD family hydrolase
MIKIISTDFDGTFFAEFENPPVPPRLQGLIGDFQRNGTKWVINTGRDMSSLMETLGRASLDIEPDFLVLVEREIFCHDQSQYVGLENWNRECERVHAILFERVRGDLPEIVGWINARFHAQIYEDNFSPFCLIARDCTDANSINSYLEDYCRRVPGLTVMRNDIYARFSHRGFNKGTALREITKQVGVAAHEVFAIGDHLNDLPMLMQEYAGHLAAPANAIEQVKRQVLEQGGYVSTLPQGRGVADALERCLCKIN